MRTRLFRSPALVLLAPLLASAAVLENSHIRVVFDDARGGAITSFVDKKTGLDFAASGAPSLYEIVLTGDSGQKTRLTEADGSGVSAAVRRSGRQQIASISAVSHAGRKIGTAATCTLDDRAKRISCRIKVSNPSGLKVFSIRFPSIAMPVRLGDSADDDRLLLPKCDGQLVENPEASFRPTEERVSAYPGTASVQLLAYYDGTAGLYAATEDSEGYRKALGASRVKNSLGLVLRYYPETDGREMVEVPYPAVLGVFHGDWQTAAGEYKKWAVGQPWCRRTLAQRDDLPQWLRKAPFFYAVSLRGQRPDKSYGYRGELVAQNVAEWGRALDWPVCPMLMSWEKHGPWITPDYFPPVGGDREFRQITAGMNSAGYRPLVFLSGLNWTLSKTERAGTPAYDDVRQFRERGEAHATVGEDGKVQESGSPGADVGLKAQICPATPLARELLVSATLGAIESGVPAVQVDQMVGGGVPACYSTRHGHPPGGGNWSHLAVERLIREVRAEGARRSKDYIFLLEEPGELYIPLLHAYHARDYMEGRWPRDGKGARGVPLFTYLYHEYCLGYGGDSAGMSLRLSRQNELSAALNLINGKIPAAAVWNQHQPPSTVHADQMKVLRGAIALLRTPAIEYLMYGQRLRTDPLGVPEVSIPITITAGQSRSLGQQSYPAVLHSGWSLPGGRAGFVFANLTGAPIAFDFVVNWVDAGRRRYRLRAYAADGSQPEILAERAALPHKVRLTVPPKQPVFVEAAVR